MHFSLKRQWERKNLLLRWKTYPKSTQGVDFSKLQNLMMEGWDYYVSEWLFSLVIAYPKHKFNTLSCVRGKWENSTLNSLMSNKTQTFYFLSSLNLPNCKLSSILLVPSSARGMKNSSFYFFEKSEVPPSLMS